MSMTKSASRSIGAATSSVSMVVPLGRAAPPEVKKPLRMSHSALEIASSVEKSTAVAPFWLRMAMVLAVSLASSSALGAATSISTAGESGPRKGSSGASGLRCSTVASARRSIYSAAITPVVLCTPPLDSAMIALAAVCGSGKGTSAVALNGCSGMVL